jgi:hypothetical protein
MNIVHYRRMIARRGATDDRALSRDHPKNLFIIQIVDSYPSWRFGGSRHRLPPSSRTAPKVSDLGAHLEAASRREFYSWAHDF